MINITCGLSGVFSQQIDINLVEMMPNMPSPYEMRDWKQVALGYDSLVFDFTQTGEYLPLIWWNPDPVNYPEHPSFGLETYVGTIFLHAGEAINIIPAVIGASLVGVNKSEQNGQNWALMCEEFFNRRPEENIYLNRFVSCSGNDWWYDTMPNIFFYQLNYLYPNTGDFSWQFTTIADQWLRAVKAMGGNAAPWNVPYMNYRGWSFSTMSPGSEEYPEPEAAGAIAWLLYNAYAETGQEEYRIGAEWALEFLNGWPQNPSYELQMPYGAYAAARMNAELGTNYDIEKMVNWCFDRGEIRGWGAIIGNWGGYDVSGLIGELSDNEYAFLMNGFEQVGALVPMVRYDDRFARAVGKWVLNVANASRLFYANYLPPGNQDSENWAYQYDTQSYIGYEAIRENLYANTPYATGDAISGGWANTNLALYGSSHVGIMGGIIDTTNVSMILKLDMLKADYYRDEAYPTYLYFNPYSEDQIVEIDVGGGMYDLYNAVSNSFLATSISGVSSIIIPADQAVQLVIIPSGGIVTYDLERMLVNNIVVDYRSGQQVSNYPPRIKSLAADSITVNTGNSTTLYCTAEDKDNDLLFYSWNAAHGTLSGDSAVVQWTAPETPGVYNLKCEVSDENGGLDSAVITVNVTEPSLVNNDIFVPKENKLYSNYPNPFNSQTIICYDLSKADHVILKIFNLLGQEVRTLVDKPQTAGTKQAQWDGRDNSNKQVPTGIYIYMLKTGSFVEARKMTFLK